MRNEQTISFAIIFDLIFIDVYIRISELSLSFQIDKLSLIDNRASKK